MKAFVPLLSKQKLSDSIRLLTRAIGQLDAEDIDVAQGKFTDFIDETPWLSRIMRKTLKKAAYGSSF